MSEKLDKALEASLAELHEAAQSIGAETFTVIFYRGGLYKVGSSEKAWNAFNEIYEDAN